MSVPRKLHGDEGSPSLRFWPPTDLCFFPACLALLGWLSEFASPPAATTTRRTTETNHATTRLLLLSLPPPDKPHITWRIWHESTNEQAGAEVKARFLIDIYKHV